MSNTETLILMVQLFSRVRLSSGKNSLYQEMLFGRKENNLGCNYRSNLACYHFVYSKSKQNIFHTKKVNLLNTLFFLISKSILPSKLYAMKKKILITCVNFFLLFSCANYY